VICYDNKSPIDLEKLNIDNLKAFFFYLFIHILSAELHFSIKLPLRGA
jgi:hypothetical protein